MAALSLVVTWSVLPVFTLGAILIAWISWLDDLHAVSSRVRFGTHATSALLVIVFIGYWHTLSLPMLPVIASAFLGIPLTFLWVVGLTNAYNFMDGIDGLAGGQAVVAGTTWLGLGLITGLPLVSLLGLFVAGSSLGFLVHNWSPARIFMGDVGSAFLGFTLAVIAVLGSLESPELAYAGVLVVWPFIFDTSFTILRRLRRKENIFEAHRSHLYQRLVIAGYSHRSVALLYLCLAAIGSVSALLWVANVAGGALLAAVIPLLLAACLWLLVITVEQRQVSVRD
jgi:UDP-N-acetylmuramyl pentapeptide phosphotransferase/UDP-N-acetylglucosamine-1-phosphate transferase